MCADDLCVQIACSSLDKAQRALRTGRVHTLALLCGIHVLRATRRGIERRRRPSTLCCY